MKASRSCDPELYSRIKDAVSMQQAVEYCGLHILNGKCLCPFHKDTHPSMKIYPNGKGITVLSAVPVVTKSNLWRSITGSVIMKLQSSWRRLTGCQSMSR